jgi:UDP-N-acetylglucosamine 2-epimerase (non-hydrolysing)
MNILHVVGARPNFMKAAPVLRVLRARPNVNQILVHTGQHYDAEMSEVFFDQLKIPRPDVSLAVGSGTHAEQTAAIMVRFEPVVLERKPDWVLVYGDVNSTVAAALVCSKIGIKVAHVEAGLRSFDRNMPEEINRVLTDQIADLLLTPSADGDANLLREGIPRSKIRFVGNTMIDTLIQLLPLAASLLSKDLPSRFALVTLHRPSNVDDPAALRELCEVLVWLSARIEVFFPVHPRTRRRFQEFELGVNAPGLHLLPPIPYLQFLGMEQRASVVLTDSGGIQEETTYLGVPCLTLRENTERPSTMTLGTNVVVGRDMGRLRMEILRVLNGDFKRGTIPPLWDGHASDRIADCLCHAAECKEVEDLGAGREFSAIS